MRVRIYLLGDRASVVSVLWANIIVRSHPSVFLSGSDWFYFSGLLALVKGKLHLLESPMELSFRVLTCPVEFRFCSSPAPALTIVSELKRCDAIVVATTQREISDNVLRWLAYNVSRRCFPAFWRRRVTMPIAVLGSCDPPLARFASFSLLRTFNISLDSVSLDREMLLLLSKPLVWLLSAILPERERSMLCSFDI